MSGALDGLARIVIVALSLLATLAIIGSISAIPSGSIEGRLGVGDTRPAADQPVARPESLATPLAMPDTGATPGEGGTPGAPVPPRERDPIERWLESISYALIAIAALMAAGLFLLWRALGIWRRMADAAER